MIFGDFNQIRTNRINASKMIKTLIIVIQFIVIVVLGWLLFIKSESITSNITQTEQTTVSPYKNANISFELIASEGNTWGYKIFLEGSPLIIQPNKPGLPGNAGFETKEQAIKVAELVISKIRNGEMPPTVTIDELKGLGVL